MRHGSDRGTVLERHPEFLVHRRQEVFQRADLVVDVAAFGTAGLEIHVHGGMGVEHGAQEGRAAARQADHTGEAFNPIQLPFAPRRVGLAEASLRNFEQLNISCAFNAKGHYR